MPEFLLSGRRLSLALVFAPLLATLLGCPGDPLDGTAGAPPHGITKAATAPDLLPAPTKANSKPAARPTEMPAYAATSSSAPRVLPANARMGAAPRVHDLEDSAQQQGTANTQQPGPQQPSPQRVQQLISNAEASYNSGVANYRANHLEAARLDFDYAVDTLLSSGVDLKAEGPLADEFDRLISAINSLELLALKQGNGFSQKIDEAPLDNVADTTFAPNPELVAKLKGELNTSSDLSLDINDEVAGYIGIFSNSRSFRDHMAASLRRAGKYRTMMQRILKEEGVPQDMIYLAVAESGFQPQALNARSGAGGMWQFIVGTGNEYGLTRNGYFDYRFDPEKETRAYARYIRTLYKQFGDWNLAMAGYNWGPNRVVHALSKTDATDFWGLYRAGALPHETRAYVPQILAAIIIAKNPERFGLNNITPDQPVLYDTVTTNYAIDLRLAAEVTQSSVQEIVALNPALLRLVTPRDISFDLHIPVGTKELYDDRLKDIPEDRRDRWRFHIVKPGETLAGITSALHASEGLVAQTNGISPQDPMSVGDELVIPVESAASVDRPDRYTVEAGDSLVTIADRFNLSVEDLRQWNSLTNAGASGLKAGRVLYVTQPIRLAPSGRGRSRRSSGSYVTYSRHGRRVTHYVVRGGSRGRAARGESSRSSRGSARSSRGGRASATRGRSVPGRSAGRAASGRKGSSSHAAAGRPKRRAGR